MSGLIGGSEHANLEDLLDRVHPMNKQQILNEIVRAAKASGGIPPGVRKFYTETGIKEYDWQKYWPRWNDALREAGFSPNKKTIAYDEDLLIEKFIGLMREIGQFPLRGDLNFKSHHDSKFPNPKTFRRLGDKSRLTERIIEYCNNRKGHEDILKLCAGLAPKKAESLENEPSAIATIGFVYLAKSGRYYKIGRTNAVGRREYELAIQLPEKLQAIHNIETDDPIGIEAYWHKRFESKRKQGEWFELNTADIKAFKRWKRIV